MTERQMRARFVVALPFAILGLAGLAYILYRSDEPSMAKGAMAGGAAMVIALVVAAVAGKRSAPGRVALRLGDERDNRIAVRSGAHAAVAMGSAAVVCTIGAAYGLPALAVGALVGWAGILAFAISFTVQTRRR